MNERYSRQVRFRPIGEIGQERLAASVVGIVGMGALGTVIADQLVRAGIGRLKIVDRDVVELSNLQRQTLFDEEDARLGLPKAIAARQRLGRINSEVQVEALVADLNADNMSEWVEGLDLVLDGLDNFETRFVLNDACRSAGVGWVYGAVVGSYGLVLPIVSGGPCLRCAMDVLPPPGSAATCETEGVIAPATATVGALEVGWALRILSAGVSPGDVRLTTVDVWTLRFQSVAIGRDPACPLCSDGRTDYLTSGPLRTVTLCGRNAVQLIPETPAVLDLAALSAGLGANGPVEHNEFLLRCSSPPYELTLFRDGRAIVRGTEEPSVARSVYSRMVGN